MPMVDLENPAMNWEDTAHYARLLKADERHLAWEFLRRNSIYAAAARGQPPLKPIAHRSGARIFAAPLASCAARWGLCFYGLISAQIV